VRCTSSARERLTWKRGRGVVFVHGRIRSIAGPGCNHGARGRLHRRLLCHQRGGDHRTGLRAAPCRGASRRTVVAAAAQGLFRHALHVPPAAQLLGADPQRLRHRAAVRGRGAGAGGQAHLAVVYHRGPAGRAAGHEPDRDLARRRCARPVHLAAAASRAAAGQAAGHAGGAWHAGACSRRSRVSTAGGTSRCSTASPPSSASSPRIGTAMPALVTSSRPRGSCPGSLWRPAWCCSFSGSSASAC